MPWTWCELWWCRINLPSLHLFPVFPDLLSTVIVDVFMRKQACPRSAFSYKQKWYYFTKKKQGMSHLSHPSKAGHPSWDELSHLIPLTPTVNNINLLLTISIHCQEIRLWELLKWSPRENALIIYDIILTHSLRKCTENSLENLYVDFGA